MGRLPRRLALWGGAAAIAGGGFAFMASNNVLASSAGEGAGSVSGYTISHESYGIVNTDDATDNDNQNTGINQISFTVTSTATTGNADTPPTSVWVYLEYTSGRTILGRNRGTCRLTGTWGVYSSTNPGPTALTNGKGHGKYVCTETSQFVVTVKKVDIEVSQ